VKLKLGNEHKMIMNALLYVASVAAILVLMSSVVVLIGWLVIKILKVFGRLVRALTNE